MNHFTIYQKNDVEALLNIREGETKFGEKISLISSFEELNEHPSPFVLFGIPEDIGIRANQGKAGAGKTWSAFLKTFLNIQENQHNNAQNLILLGHVDCDELNNKAFWLSPDNENYFESMGELVRQLDEIVYEVVRKIKESGKTPICIGGGHNNAYGMIKGCSQALGYPINVFNIDAHTDLRKLEHRHSGNGFSYANQEGYFDKYYVYGLQKNYTPQYIFDLMDSNKSIKYSLFEDCLHLTTLDKLVKMKTGFDFLRNEFGLELDCDVIENFNSSAITPSGFTFSEVRTFIKLAKKLKVHYFHICEASTDDSPLVTKALAYIVSDFIRSEDN